MDRESNRQWHYSSARAAPVVFGAGPGLARVAGSNGAWRGLVEGAYAKVGHGAKPEKQGTEKPAALVPTVPVALGVSELVANPRNPRPREERVASGPAHPKSLTVSYRSARRLRRAVNVPPWE